MYAACKENAEAFESFGVWTSGAATVTGMGDPEQVTTVTATQGVLPTLLLTANRPVPHTMNQGHVRVEVPTVEVHEIVALDLS